MRRTPEYPGGNSALSGKKKQTPWGKSAQGVGFFKFLVDPIALISRADTDSPSGITRRALNESPPTSFLVRRSQPYVSIRLHGPKL